MVRGFRRESKEKIESRKKNGKREKKKKLFS
jgi:hypothetical protein